MVRRTQTLRACTTPPRPPDLREQLTAAYRRVGAGLALVAAQRARRERLRFAGCPIDDADDLLRVLEQSLVLMYRHRRALERELRAQHPASASTSYEIPRKFQSSR